MSLFNFVVLAALVALVRADAPQVNTPASVQACLPVQISWSGGTPPYFVGLIAAGQPSSPVLKDFGTQTGTSYVWNVDSPAGTSYTVQIRDSLGQLNYSDQFTVQPSSQTCSTGGSNSSSPSPAPSPSTTAGKNSTSSSSSSNTSASAAKPSTGSSNTSATTPVSGSTSSSSSPTTGSTNANTTGANAARTSDASRMPFGYAALALSLALAVFA